VKKALETMALCLFFLGLTVAAQSVRPQMTIPAIAKDAHGAVVSIIMSKDGSPIAQGSGFLISKDGLILTNYHVIESGNSAIAKLPDGAFYVVDGVLAFDKARDVAIIKAHGENFRTLTLGNSDQLQVGEEVVAIGNPLSLESTVSNGIISGIRTIEEEGGKFLQVTTPISPGSSGGPLFNMAGEVVGITTLYFKGGENLNFAIPINDAKRLLLANSSKAQALPNETELPPIWRSATTGKEYRVQIDGDRLTAEWSNIPPQAAQQGAYIRSECRRSGARWVGTSRILLSCSLPHGKTKMCPMLLRFEVDFISSDHITGGGEILKDFDCGSCEVRKTGWGPFSWVPIR